MWNIIQSLRNFVFPTESPSVSLDEAYKIMSEDRTHPEEKKQYFSTTNTNPEALNTYESIVKVGRITNANPGGEFIIDDKYSFKSNLKELQTGSKISYQLIYEQKIREFRVIDVNILSSDNWDAVASEGEIHTWCTRQMVCKVSERLERSLLLNPGGISLDLNCVSAEFVPIPGDWLTVDVKCEIDENVTDFCGKVLEVNSFKAVRNCVDSGRITQWDALSMTGLVDRRIHFTDDALTGGYFPHVGDHVVFESIESEQGYHTWRALKIVPDFLINPGRKKQQTSTNNQSKIIEDYCEDYEGVSISKELTVSLKKLGDLALINIHVENTTSATIDLLEVSFPSHSNQCKLLNQANSRLAIKSNTVYPLQVECTARSIGFTKEPILIKFQQFQIYRWICICVDSEKQQLSSTANKHQLLTNGRKQQQLYDLSNSQSVVSNAIRGVRTKPTIRFATVKLPNYAIPQRMLELFTTYQCSPAEPDLIKALETWKTCLLSDLSYINYEERFHTLLYIEECNSLVNIERVYNQERVSFIKFDEYLLLEVANLRERQPTLIIGDRIIATTLFATKQLHFEGFIHKIGREHLFLKFLPAFHDTYNGEDYSIKASTSRTPFQRLHYGVTMAVKNLGTAFLFPTKFVERKPQFNVNVLESDPVYWYNQQLNSPQKQAILRILEGVGRALPYVVFGPPGTGKTATLVEAILQTVRLQTNCRILVVAPSNSATNVLTSRLISYGAFPPGELVRLVAYSAISSLPDELAPYSVVGHYARVGTETETSTVCPNGLTIGANSEVIGRHKITLSTCQTVGLIHLLGYQKGHFTHVFIDEAGQATEPSVMLALALVDVRGSNVGQAVLAGDPMQLGPTVISNLATNYGLSHTFLERIFDCYPYLRDPIGFPNTSGYNPNLLTMLLYNYRSLPTLLKLPSKMFYHDDLLPTISAVDSSEAQLLNRLVEILPQKQSCETPCIVFHGVNGTPYQPEESPSWCNPDEAAQIFYYINELYRSGLTSKDVGIITAYRAQVQTLRDLCAEVEFTVPKIGTVEEFQGQEFNVILLSVVRAQSQSTLSNDSLGFVACPRRLNVAITRAKSLLIIVGNPALLQQHSNWRTLIEFCIENGSYTGCPYDMNK